MSSPYAHHQHHTNSWSQSRYHQKQGDGLLIPFEFAFRGLLVSHAILLCTACIDINEVSVGIILVGMTNRSAKIVDANR